MVGLWCSELDLSVYLSLSPSFCRYKTFLSEDAGPETLVAIVHAKDPDGDGVTYAITGGNEDSNFELDNQKGESSGMKTQSSLLWYQHPCIRYNASGMLSLTRTSKKHIFFFLSAQHASLIHHSTHVCGICWKNKHPLCCFWSTALVFCVCALVCECNVCLFSCLPACSLSVSRLHLSAVFAFHLFISTFYAWELENSSMLKLSPVLSASRHGCSITQPITGQCREMAHGFSTQKSCVELSLQRCSSTFFAHKLFGEFATIRGPFCEVVKHDAQRQLSFFTDIYVFYSRGCHFG